MLFIVTPVFNRKKFTYNYLLSLKEQNYNDFKVIIVDDGSTDGTSKMIKNDFPEVILIETEGNLWWSESTNFGVKHAISMGASQIIIMNNDTLLEPTLIFDLLSYSKDHPNSLLMPVGLHHKTKVIIDGGWNINWKTAKYRNMSYQINNSNSNNFHNVNVAPARCLLIPIEVFDKIGFFESNKFPQAVADFDFTSKANRFGFEILVCYNAKIMLYPLNSGSVDIIINKSIKNYFLHLFGRKGLGNLKWFILFAIRNSPKKYLFTFIILGIIRRLVNYFTIQPKQRGNKS